MDGLMQNHFPSKNIRSAFSNRLVKVRTSRLVVSPTEEHVKQV